MELLSDIAVQSEPWLQWGALLGASLAAAIMDIRHGRIPNRLTLSLWLLGLIKATCLGSLSGLFTALEVSVLLAAPYVALYFIAKGGAGDAKLMGAIGAWLTPDEGVVVFCCVAITGMVLAIFRIAAHHQQKNALIDVLASLYLLAIAWSAGPRGWKLFTSPPGGQTQGSAGQISLPYGLVIFIGVCIGAVGARVWNGQSG
jgi:Flp pilus assembly protein protease CpaA